MPSSTDGVSQSMPLEVLMITSNVLFMVVFFLNRITLYLIIKETGDGYYTAPLLHRMTKLPSMSNLDSHKFFFSRTQLHLFCLIVISLSPLAVRWATTAAHMDIFRDSTGQPSDLLGEATAPAPSHAEHSSETHRDKMMGIRPHNRQAEFHHGSTFQANIGSEK